MLSPGQFHKRVPREMQANIRWRLYVAEKAKGNRELQQAVCWACKNDIIFFINTFIIQINPELRELGPFILFPGRNISRKDCWRVSRIAKTCAGRSRAKAGRRGSFLW